MKKLFLLLAIVFNINTHACDCDIKPSVNEDWNYSDEVLTAKIISIDSSHFSTTGNKIYLLNAAVIHFFKKKPNYVNYEMRTFFFRGDGGCDFPFNLNEEYLIYSSRVGGVISNATICSRTALLSNVKQEEINELIILSNNISIHKGNSIDDDIITWVTEKELKNFRQQEKNTQKLAEQNKCLMILYAIIFIAAIVFFILYIKTKKKLKAAKKL